MSVEKTEVKVIKIEKSPSQYYTPQKVEGSVKKKGEKLDRDEIDVPRISEWVKEGAEKTEKKQASRLEEYYFMLISAVSKEKMEKMWRMLKENACRFGKGFRKYCVRIAADRAKRLAASGVACAILFGSCTVTIFATCTMACRIKLGDKEIGTLPSEQAYYEILSDVKEEVFNVADIEFEPSGELSVNHVLIGKGQYTSEEVVKEKLKSTSGEMIPAWTVSVEDDTVVALATQKEALSMLDNFKRQFEGENAVVTFRTKVSVERKFVPVQILKTEEEALKYLNSDVAPQIEVQAVVECEGEEEIPFETEQRTDETQYEGNVTVLQKGVAGAKYVKYYSTRINGEEIEKKVLEDEILRQPVKQIEIVGTKERPSPVGTGEFARPASGTLTSNFGSRWGRNHNGIDIGASVGTPVYASDNGTVIYSQYNNGGYGNLVQIDHGNGFVTYYAHCSELIAKVGDVVAKGDVIARVGNTGRSTGPHLHFEVRKGGEVQNPANYLN